MDEFHLVMTNHRGRRSAITCRQYTVEMTYYFPIAAGDINAAGEEETVVLNLSHDKNGVFTKNHFQDEGDKPRQYKTLKEDIDRIGVKYSLKAGIQYMSGVARPDGLDVFYEVRKALDEMNCTEIEEREIRQAIKFTGYYDGIAFMFNVYHKINGKLNTKPKGSNGRKKQPQNPVWDKPKPPPSALKMKIDDVISLVKKAEAGGSTESEIPGMDDLKKGLAKLSVSV